MKQVLSPKELAQAIGVSESSLKRWTDDGLIRASRTAGGHRRIPITEAIRFVRDTKATLIHPEIFGLPDLDSVSGDLPARDDEADRLLTYLREGRAAETRGLVMSMYLAGRSVAEICDGPLHHAMEVIRDLWQHSAEGIFIEHRATDICIQAVDQLRLTLHVERDAPMAVGGAPAGDPYVLPSLAAATVLTSEGLRTVNLGANSPAEALLQAATHHKADFIWLSVSTHDHKAALSRQVELLVGGLAETGLSLVLGGRGVDGLHLPRTGNLHLGRSMGELVAFAKGVALARKTTGGKPTTNGH